ncbi:MAG: hypothetical protein ACOC1O_00685 [bacterium]
MDSNVKSNKKESSKFENGIVCDHCNSKIIYDDLLNKYGPEGLYEIANKLKQIADEDVNTALKQSYYG